jgi:hypothetical protein
VCVVGASAAPKVWAKLTPSSGDWSNPRMVVGGSMPSASRTVGTMSMACAYCVRISPRAAMPVGQASTKGSVEVVVEALGHVVEEQHLVERAGGPALGGGAVVGDDHDQGVVELADLFERVE